MFLSYKCDVVIKMGAYTMGVYYRNLGVFQLQFCSLL